MPPDEDPWSEAVPPADPQRLPPGFYFPPGTGPHAAPPSRGTVGKWIAAVVAVLLAIAIAVGVTLFLAREDAAASTQSSVLDLRWNTTLLGTFQSP